MTSKLTLQEKREYLQLLEERKYRKQINPLNFCKLLPIQQLFYDDPAKTKFACGGNRSGKSEVISKYVIDKCLANPNQKWWMVSETYQDSVNILQKKVWSLLPKYNMKYCKWNPVTGFTNKKIIFGNDSFIRFLSYEQGRTAFQGDDVDGIANDEEPPYDIYQEERMRLLDRNGEMLFSMTSLRGMTELLSNLYEGANTLKSQIAPLLDNEKVPRIAEKNGVKFFFLWTTENPHIDQDRVLQEAAIMNKNEIKSRIYGLPTGVALRIYPMFNPQIHVIPWKDIPDTEVTLYHIVDPHDRKPWAMQWWIYHKLKKSYCIYEYPFNKNFNDIDWEDKTYEDYAKLIKDIEAMLAGVFGRQTIRRIIDPNFGNATIQKAYRSAGTSKTTVKKEMENFGIIFQDGFDSVPTGHLSVRKALHWAEKDDQIIIHPTCYIAEHCQNTILHLSRYSFQDIETSSGDIKDSVKPKEKYKDFADCTRYYFSSNPKYIPIPKQKEEKIEKIY